MTLIKSDSPNIRLYIFIMIAYLLLSLIITYPLAMKFTTHNAGSNRDDQLLMWNLWWVKYALMDLKTNPFYTDYIFYPHQVNLTFHAFTFLNGILSIPLQHMMGIVTIYNLFFILSFVLSGFGGFLLTKYFVKDWKAAFIGGIIFAVWRVPLRGNLGATQWMPFYILYLFKTLDSTKGHTKYALIAGIMLGFNFLSEYYYFIFMAIFTIVVLVFYIVKKNAGAFKTVKKVCLISLFSIPFILPVMFFVVKVILSGDTRKVPLSLNGHNLVNSVVDLFGFFSPHPENPIIGRFSFSGYFTGLENFAFVGLIVIFFSVFGWLSARRTDNMASFWLISALVFVILSLGPYPHILGRELKIPLPFYLFRYIPSFDNLTVPARFHTLTMLHLSVLAGYGMKYILVKRGYLLGLTIPIILLEYFIPMSVFKNSIPPVYEHISRDQKAQSILQIPFFVRDTFTCMGISADPSIQSYQSVHHKKILNGCISRLGPESIFYSYLNLPVISTISLIQSDFPVRPEYIESDKRLVGEVVNLLGLGYVVIYKSPLVVIEGSHQYLKYVMPMQKIYEDENIVVYKVIISKPDIIKVDIGTETSIPYLYRGWINGQKSGKTTYAWITGKESTLLLNLDSERDYEMLLHMRPHETLKKKALRVFINDVYLSRLALEEGWKTYSVRLPKDSIKNGINRIKFRPEDTVVTDEEFGAIWARGLPTDLLRKMDSDYLKKPSEMILEWELDNTKFSKSPISTAFDFIEVMPILKP